MQKIKKKTQKNRKSKNKEIPQSEVKKTRKKTEKYVSDGYIKVDNTFRSDNNKMEEFKRGLELGEFKFAYYALEDDIQTFYYKKTLSNG